MCEPVQEQIGQVLAKIWALKAWLNQPIIRQVQVQIQQSHFQQYYSYILLNIYLISEENKL